MLLPNRLSAPGFSFFLIFTILYIFSGSFIYFTGLPYRPIYVIFLILPLILVYEINLARYLIYLLLFLVITLISLVINNSSITGFIQYLRFLVVPFLMVFLVDTYFRPYKINKILKWLVFVALIQIPVVVIQKIFYNTLIPLGKGTISEPDFYFGTFPWSGDPSMTFFLNCLIIYFLFNERHCFSNKRRFLLSILLSIPIILSGSDVMRLINFFLWASFFTFKFKKIVTLTILISLIFFTPFISKHIQMPAALSKVMLLKDVNEIPKGRGTLEEFKSGKYAREAGFYYFFIHKPISLFGDGPGEYVAGFSKKMKLGISGHLLLFYAEIGLLGLFASYMTLYKINFRHKKTTFFNSNKCLKYLFISLLFLSLTSNILNDTSVMFTVAIFSKLFNITNHS